MYLEKLQNVLAAEGIVSRIVSVTKNTVPCSGLSIGESPIAPILYWNEGESEDSFVKRARKALNETCRLDMNLLTDGEYIRNHVFLSIQRPSTENVVKRSYLNLEIIIRLSLNLLQNESLWECNTKLTPELVRMTGLNIDDIWESAFNNTRNMIQIRSMDEILGLPEGTQLCPFFVASADYDAYGAVALVFPELIEEFCKSSETSHVWILPSSTEEILILPDDDESFEPTSLSKMVAQVNASEVQKELQLDPVVYEYFAGTGVVQIAKGGVHHG